ncbi:Phosphotransferase enzyme family protein [Microbacterium sp. cf046]|uniref:phosphotransferase n=1 Tax=Microbacterium sp. cf046 TaxID=1761803 RepID=UPI0008EB3F0C|nr:phosphotransferase [Microbacterium sp. cf046]SFR86197.1 Phosphotransferase enzyme family protein [Microbacterium sp. cf046]
MEHLPGGSGGVWLGDDPAHGPTVHRPTGPWSPAVHELLNFLADAGLDGIPRVLGFDDAGREVLTFVPGRTVAVDSEAPADATLTDAARWLRRFHDAVAAYDPGPRTWRQSSAGLEPGQLICHNDTGAYNWIVEADRFVGMIDWDQAGPGLPLDDLAFLCWSGIPLFREIPTTDAAHRVQIAAEAYGGVEPRALLDAVADRMQRASDRIAAGIERGDPGMMALRAVGEPERTRRRVDAFSARLPALRAALS